MKLHARFLSCIGTLVLVLGTTNLAAQPSTPRDSTWVTNGDVYSFAYLRGILYLGGNFTFVGPNTGNGTPISTITGSAYYPYPKPNGNVHAVAPDGSGGWYVGGEFTNVGGVTRNRLAHILSNGQLNATWDPDVNGTVRTIVVAGSVVYVGGDFTRIAGVQRNRIAGISTSTDQVSWYPTGGANNTVNTIQVASGIVYAGGTFTSIGGQTRNRIAALEDGTASVLAWNPNANNTVFSILASSSTIFVGGSFSNIGGQVRNYTAALDSATGNALSWNPNPDNTVRTLAKASNVIYLGGDFLTIGGQNRSYIAAAQLSTGSVTSWNPNSNGVVRALLYSGSVAYVAGDFSAIGGQIRGRLASVDTLSGTTTGWAPHTTTSVRCLALTGSTLYAGGDFRSIGGKFRNNLAALDAVTGTATPWNPNADATVWDIAVSGTTVYVGGEFSNVAGQTRNRLAGIDISTGNVTSWNPNANNPVYAVTVSGSNVYVGGGFSNVGGQLRRYLAAMDISTGNVTSWNPSVTGGPILGGWVTSILARGQTIYIGGAFSSVGGQTRNNLAAVDVITGVPTAWNPSVSVFNQDYVYSMTVSDTIMYIAGRFNGVSGQTRNNLAAVGISSGLPTGWNPNANGAALSISTSGSAVYTGGAFTSVGGFVRNRLVALDPVTGIPTGWGPSATGGDVSQILSVVDTVLIIAGSFSAIDGKIQDNVAQFGNIPLNPVPNVTNTSPTSASRLHTLNVTINGSGFISGETSVRFGSDITLNSLTVNSSTQIIANITIAATAVTGARSVSATNGSPGGGTGTLSSAFTVNNPAPTLTNITPTSGNRLQSLDVTFTGSNFISGVTSANVGTGITVNANTINSSTILTANITITASADTGARSFSVTNMTPGGGTSTSQTFRVNNPAPTLTSISPTSGTRGQTLNVNFTGSNFISGVSSANVGTGITVNSTTVNSSTSLTANITVSASADTGARNFSVTNATPGGGTSRSVTFRVVNNPPSAVRLVQPTNGDTVKLTIPRVPLVFRWRKSFDLDLADTVKYTLRMTGVSIDTIMSRISDTTASLDIMSNLQVASIYSWTVNATDGFTTVVSPDTFKFRTSSTVTAVSSLYSVIPKEYQLNQNYPNPFNPTTTIKYGLPARSVVSLAIYNLLGQVVSELVDGEKETGYHEVQWQAQSSSGLYFYRLEATRVDDPSKRFVEVKKMILLR